MFAPYLTQILSSATDAETRALQSGRRVASRGSERGDLRVVFSRDRRPGTSADDASDASSDPDPAC